jgi:hypothetical protein
MASKTNIHAARTSPIPGFVVIVLAVAAVFFGLAIVRQPRTGLELLQREALALKLDELVRTNAATHAALTELQQRTAALEYALQRDGASRR